MKQKPHKQLILEWLQKYGSITPMDAMRFSRPCMRLAARIAYLRAEGYNIITDDEDSNGNKVAYAIYRLIKEETANA